LVVQLPVQAPLAHIGALQLPSRQSNWQVEPSSQVAFGQTEPPLVHEKSQVEPAWHVTSRPAQLPDELQLKLQV
jgi:hypothetical protein